jgi:hypothetical protein
MSVVATFYVLDRKKLPDLEYTLEPIDEVLEEQGRSLDPDVYEWSGSLMLHLLLYLDDQDIPILDSGWNDPRGDGRPTVFVFTADHKELLPQLEPSGHTGESIRTYFDEMGYGFDEVGPAVADALTLLREEIGRLRYDEALVLTIG